VRSEESECRVQRLSRQASGTQGTRAVRGPRRPSAEEAQEKGEKVGTGVVKRLRNYGVKIPASRAEYTETFKNLALAFERVKRQVNLTGCDYKKPLTTIDLRMWVKIDPPRIAGMPWVTGTPEDQKERVLQTMRQGVQTITHLAHRIGYNL